MKMAKCVPIFTQAYKRCCKCGEVKPLINFHKDRGAKDGCHYACKECRRIEWLLYYSNPISKERKRQWKQALIQSGESAKYDNERYHKIQDRFNCHRTVPDWYPAARLIEALETAPIVEI